MTIDPYIFGEMFAAMEKGAAGMLGPDGKLPALPTRPSEIQNRSWSDWWNGGTATHDAYGFAKNLPTTRIDPQTGQTVPIQLPEGRHTLLGIAGNTVANMGENTRINAAGRTLVGGAVDIGSAIAKHPESFLQQWAEPPKGSTYVDALLRAVNNKPGTERGDADFVSGTRGMANTAAAAGTAAGGLQFGTGLATGAYRYGLAPALRAGGWLGGKVLGGAATGAGLATGIGGAGVGTMAAIDAMKPRTDAEKGTAVAPGGAKPAPPTDVPGAIMDWAQKNKLLAGAAGAGIASLGAYGLYNLLAPRLAAAKKKKKQAPAHNFVY